MKALVEKDILMKKMGSARRSNRRKKTQEKGQRGKILNIRDKKRENIEALYKRLKIN